MAETFNPYAEWLGVQSASALPNHYELLRLEPFESRPDTILTAANMQMAKVRSVRPGEHVEVWRRLLDELNTAKRCLCDWAEKSNYDAALREKGWPGANARSNVSSPWQQSPAGAPVGGADGGVKRSPSMEVTDAGMSNPLPPGFGGGKTPAADAPISAEKSGGDSRDSNRSAAWQPGTNLLPPTPRKPQDGAGDKPWSPTAPSAAQMPQSTAPPQAPRPKLVFPGETVPAAATAMPSSPSPPASGATPSAPGMTPMPPSPAAPAPAAGPPTSPAGGFPAPGPLFPQAMPQQGGFNQFSRPFPSMPGMAPQGQIPPYGAPQYGAPTYGAPQYGSPPYGTPPNAAPPNAMPPGGMQPSGMPPSGMPQQPAVQQPFGQQPFAGPFYPGGQVPGGGSPQYQPFGAGTPGGPTAFPHPMAPNPYGTGPYGTGPYAPGPMPPGGMPGFYPQPGGMPPMPGNYPQQPQPGMPQPGMPQPGMPQPSAQQPAAPQVAQPTGGTSFLDDVLSGPARGGQSAFDELGFGDSPQAPQPAPDWQAGGFSPPAEMTAAPGAIEQASPPPQEPMYDPSTAGDVPRPRPAARQKQGSQTLLIGGALGAVVLLAAVLIAAIVLRQHDDKAVAIAEQSPGAASSESSISGQQPGKTTPTGTAKLPASNPPKPKNAGPAKHPGKGGGKPSASAMHGEPSGNPSVPKQPAKKPGSNSPGSQPAKSPGQLVLQPTAPNPAMKPAKPKPPVVDPAKAARLTRLLADIRQKLAERNQEDANRMIADAKGLAVTPEQSDRVERMGTLVKYVGEFWGAVRDALGGLKATDEIDVGTTKVVVVERDEQSLTIHMGSGNKHFNLKDLPSGLALALANRWLDPSKPANKVFVGAFYAVDPKLLDDDPDAAKRLWGEAAAAGVSDGTYLLPLLNPEPVDAGMAMPAGETSSLPPVPSAEAIDRATRKIRDEFDDAIVSATTATKLNELIQRFFDAADTSDEPARRYALYIQARDTAARAGRAKLTIEAIDRISHDFSIDALAMKADTFANNLPTTAEGGREITRAALALIDEAVAAKRIDVASRLAQVAVAAAQVSNGNDLIKRATQRSKQIEALAGKKMAADSK